MNVSVNASATPFQQPSGYGSHGYSTGKRPRKAPSAAAGLAPSLTGCDGDCCLTAVIEKNARDAAPK